jgi:hypothetical protein
MKYHSNEFNTIFRFSTKKFRPVRGFKPQTLRLCPNEVNKYFCEIELSSFIEIIHKRKQNKVGLIALIPAIFSYGILDRFQT